MHKMVELYCKKNLVSVPDWMRGHLAAWEQFVENTGFELATSEDRVYNAASGYAGTLDLAGAMLKGKKFGMAIIDIKRSFLAGPAIGIQLAAYQEAFNKTVLSADRANLRYALKLNHDGTYRLREFDEPLDYSVFLAHLTIYKHKEKYFEHYSK